MNKNTDTPKKDCRPATASSTEKDKQPPVASDKTDVKQNSGGDATPVLDPEVNDKPGSGMGNAPGS